MREAEVIFENHVDKCRCCIKSFDDIEIPLKITKTTEKLFKDVTQMELKSSRTKYSTRICQQCLDNLEQAAKVKRELIRQQKKLYAFVDGDRGKSRSSRKCKERELSVESEEEQENLFVKMEVKQEVDELRDSCLVMEPLATSLMPFVKVERIKEEQLLIPDHFYDSDSGQLMRRDEEDESDGVDDPFDEFFKSTKKKSHYKRSNLRKTITKHCCPHCKKIFHTEENLRVHIDHIHLKLKNFECTKCNFKTHLPSLLQSHEQRVHRGIKPEPKPKEPKKPCPICGLMVQKISTHTRNVHTRPKNVFCDICGFGIFNVHRLRRHMYKHLSKEEKHNLSTFVCDICGANLHTKNSIKSHMKNVHQEKGNLYTCHCGRSYKAESYLKVHQKTHEKELRHKCSQCDKAFMNLSQLKIHMEIHERRGKKNYPCEICGKMYGSCALLVRHKIFHTDPTHPCSYCGRKFHRQCLLVRHVRAQHEIQMGACEYCGKQMNVVSIKRHVLEFHTNLQRKTCPVPGCTSAFVRKFNLKDHIARMHKDFLSRLTNDEKDAFEQRINDLNLISV